MSTKSISLRGILGNEPPKPPGHLSREAKRMWRDLCAEYDVSDAPGRETLRVALEAWDRAQAAREQINKDGMIVLGADKQPKQHPLITVERDSRAAFLAGMKAMRFDCISSPKKGRA